MNDLEKQKRLWEELGWNYEEHKVNNYTLLVQNNGLSILNIKAFLPSGTKMGKIKRWRDVKEDKKGKYINFDRKKVYLEG